MGKKTLFGPLKFFWWVVPLLGLIHCCKLSLYAISRKTNESNLRKWQKNLVLGPIWNLQPKFGLQTFFCGWYLYKMLEVVASYHCMQFHRKLMNQTWENGKKPTFVSDFGPNSGHQNLFKKIRLCQSLDIMTNYHHVQYQKKANEPILGNFEMERWTNGQKKWHTELGAPLKNMDQTLGNAT